MTLFEVLASSGGITQSNSSKRIKIIEKLKMESKYLMPTYQPLMEFSRNMIMQSHDIVYVTPNFNLGSEIAQDINSVSFISTISLLWLTITQINQ